MNQHGEFILGWIDGDPQIEPMREEWYTLPREARVVRQRIAELAERELNLYIAPCLFSARKRSYKTALPSAWLWADDVPNDTVCTVLVQSSEASYQAWVHLDRPLGTDDRKRLQTVWRDRVGADACSADAVHMARLPGGYNRKRHGRYLVRVAAQTEQTWNADRLLAKLPPTEPTPLADITDLAWPEVELHLSNIDALLGSARAKCIKPNTQTGRILAGERVAIASQKLGRIDDSTSAQAAILAMGFYYRGFMDDEIAAVVFHFYQQWGVIARKGTSWAREDIGRLIALVHAKNPGVHQTPTRYRQGAAGTPIVDTPARTRARKDRPTRLDPPMLFARYRAEPALCELNRKGRAAQLGISTATLDRLEGALRGLGLIEIHTPGRGHAGRVVVMGGVINIAEQEVLSGPVDVPTKEAPITQAASEQNDDRTPQCIGGTHPPPDAPAPTAPRQATAGEIHAWVTEAFVAYPGRASLHKVRRHIRMLADDWPIDDATIARLYGAERDRRRYARQDAREVEKARKMGLKALQRKAQNLASQAAVYQRKGDKRAPVWMRRAGIYAAEEARRTAADQAQFEAQLDQLVIFNEIAAQRGPAMKPTTIGRAVRIEPTVAAPGTVGVVCSPQSTPIEVPSARELITRLKSRREAQAPTMK